MKYAKKYKKVYDLDVNRDILYACSWGDVVNKMAFVHPEMFIGQEIAIVRKDRKQVKLILEVKEPRPIYMPIGDDLEAYNPARPHVSIMEKKGTGKYTKRQPFTTTTEA